MALHGDINQAGHPPTEYVLKADCADVCLATYALRLHGDSLTRDDPESYSAVPRESLSQTLGGDLGDDGRAQATCAVKAGGLGFRTPEGLALPAFAASRTTARPGALALFKRLEQAELGRSPTLSFRHMVPTPSVQWTPC